MSLASRLRTLERLAAVPDEADRSAEWRDAFRRDLAAFLTHIPEQHRNAVAEASATDTTEQFSEWMMSPLALWAMPIPEDYVFPIALVEFMLNPPRDFWMGHHFADCGLTVPVYTTWSNDPCPPVNLKAFPVCPKCQICHTPEWVAD